MDKTILKKIAEDAASEALKTALSFLGNPQITSNNFKDIKTIADLKINETIISYLSTTDIPIISEEFESQLNEIPNLCWIIDPLDGTYNFSRNFPGAGISICLWENALPIIGIVKDIFNDITYDSFDGHGARRNGNEIKVSVISDLEDAILATGFPSGGSFETDDLLTFIRKIQIFKKIRSIGAASIMLCFVASGVFDIYYENDIYLWDVAAGLSLVKESGGEVFFRRKGNSLKYEVLASNMKIFSNSKSLLITS